MGINRRIGNILFLISLLWVCAASPLRAEEPAEQERLHQAYRFWQQGYALHLLGEFDDAVLLFRKSLESQPTAEAHTFLGWSLSKLGRLQEAIAQCKKAITLDPDYGNPYNDIGVYFIDLGRPDEAIPWLKKAMGAKRYCCYEFPHFNLGRILLMQGRLVEAKHSFERALSYNPNYQPALKGLEYLREQGLEAL